MENKFIVTDQSGMSKVGIMLEVINIASRNYGVYAVYNNEDKYDIYIGLLILQEDGSYIINTIKDKKENEMVKKLIKKQFDLIKG